LCYKDRDLTKQEIQKRVGTKIREARAAKGLSQSDLARKLIKDRQIIERYENGKSNPTIYTLHLIAECLDIPTKDLVDF